MHIHIGLLAALEAFMSVAIIGFFWRVIALRNVNNNVGQAMLLIY